MFSDATDQLQHELERLFSVAGDQSLRSCGCCDQHRLQPYRICLERLQSVATDPAISQEASEPLCHQLLQVCCGNPRQRPRRGKRSIIFYAAKDD